MTHWTERNIDDFLYRIAADFVTQLEDRIQSEPMSKSKLAQKLGVSKGRVSQILNNPGNLTLKMIIKCARALGLKVAIVAYDDNDMKNERGPVNSEIFRVCWENSGKPIDFWALKTQQVAGTSALASLQMPYYPGGHYVFTMNVGTTMQACWINPSLQRDEPPKTGRVATFICHGSENYFIENKGEINV